jgi:hypothetical protein
MEGWREPETTLFAGCSAVAGGSTKSGMYRATIWARRWRSLASAVASARAGGMRSAGLAHGSMPCPHEGSEALLDINVCSNVCHADASFLDLEEFEMGGLARVGADCDEVVCRGRHSLSLYCLLVEESFSWNELSAKVPSL